MTAALLTKNPGTRTHNDNLLLCPADEGETGEESWKSPSSSTLGYCELSESKDLQKRNPH